MVESKPIVIGQGAMVADRCVLMPGVTIGRNSVLGSGTLAPTGFTTQAGSIWLGNEKDRQPKAWHHRVHYTDPSDFAMRGFRQAVIVFVIYMLMNLM